MRNLVEKFIAKIRYEQLRYSEYSLEYQELDSLVKLLENWLQKHC